MTAIEEPLFGGLRSGRVVRIGETVRRPADASTPTVQALLQHLQSKGFPAPEPLGFDAAGREVVSFLPGRCSNWPWPPALLADDGARQVGATLRAYHDAVRGFVPPSPAIWRHGPESLGPGRIVLHGDFGPHNLIGIGDRLSGVIDFELARPGRTMEDVVFAAIRTAHLRPDARAESVGFAAVPDRRARLAAFAAGYGTSVPAILAEVIAGQRDEGERLERLGGAGVEPWAGMLAHGLANTLREELAWMDENLAGLAA